MLGAVNCQAPEVMRTGALSKQADVYAFGMLSELAELLLAAVTALFRRVLFVAVCVLI
jgi:hypothetical protein